MADDAAGGRTFVANDSEKDGAPARGSKQAVARASVNSEPPDQFLLEDLYPAAHDVFAPSCVANVQDGDAIVVLDTNTLLVPYNIKQDDLTALRTIYTRLADAGRLFLPARVAREFIKNRDSKLADLLKALNDQKSRLQVPQKRLSPLLEGVPGYDDLLGSQEALVSARKDYETKLTAVIERVRSWRGNDPVTSLYQTIFTEKNVADVTESRESIAEQWAVRLRNKTPPGYKDAGKEDTGVGDFLIWKTLLHLGADRRRDLVFVTGEEKPDWFVRSNNEGIYPRSELVDEYRRASGGKSLSLLSLSELLTQMQVEDAVVEEVRSAEADSLVESGKSAVHLIKAAKTYVTVAAVRGAIEAVFPGRKRAPLSKMAEFREELALAGFENIAEFKTALMDAAEEALANEAQDHPGIKLFYADVGIARECMRISCADFDSIIDEVQRMRE